MVTSSLKHMIAETIMFTSFAHHHLRTYKNKRAAITTKANAIQSDNLCSLNMHCQVECGPLLKRTL